ncbi:hypothetical protein [Mesobacillus selenatarsenatis]|uniref:Uncharacterized protein n=1 Tax=Mesobacillus selenatarsenatis TaxID=388741 RepID=A0A846TAP8_9BACI|nr:hypothetical protein [Mesobacillus selenatarsenatis]NKE03930.1 hypothetical protein [Mesobacillus selenatarsenatis]
MNIAVYLTLLFSLILSSLISIWVFKKEGSKWLGLLMGFLINTLILSAALIIFYKVFYLKGVEGFFTSLGILIFAFSIPINTSINFYILEFIVNRKNVSID